MCKFLGITRSLIYYHLNKEERKNNLETEELLEEKIMVSNRIPAGAKIE